MKLSINKKICLTACPAKGQVKKEMSGFAMLFAVLASSLLIALGISIFNISLKELQIATSEKDSQAAYYAADSAEECALYSDIIIGAFPTCIDSANPCTLSSMQPNSVTCNGNTTTLNQVQNKSNPNGLGYDPTGLTYTYSTSTFFSFGGITDPNASIFISKQFSPGTNPIIQTIITSYGHNSGIIGRRVERGLTETYNSQ